MKLHSPEFEKSLRRGIKERIRQSPALKREFRNAKKARRRKVELAWLVRCLWSFIPGLFVWLFITTMHHPATGLAIISLWSFMGSVFFISALLGILFSATDLPALNLLPVPDEVVFNWELQKYFRRTALPALLDQVTGFGAAALCLHFSYAQWVLAMAFAFLSWATVMSMTALCAARLPNLPYQAIGSILIVAGMTAFFAETFFGPLFMRLFDEAAPDVNLILPTGWVPTLFQYALLHENRVAIWLIIPIALILATLKNSLEILKARPKFQEFEPLRASPVPKLIRQAVARAGSVDESQDASLARIEQVIRSRKFLSLAPSERRLERQVWPRLSPREKVLAEFSFPSGFRMTRAWVIIFRNFMIMMALGFAAGMDNVKLEQCIFGVGLFVTLSHGLLRILANGMGLRAIFCSGVNIPIYAAYPIGFRESSRMLFKVAAMQLPLFLAVVIGGTELVGRFVGFSVIEGFSIGFRMGSLIFVGRFISTTMAFSSHTNDSSRFHVRTLGLIAIMVGCVFLFLILGVLGTFMGAFSETGLNPAIVWVCWAGAIVDAYLFFRIYAWFYDRNYFDLTNMPRQ